MKINAYAKINIGLDVLGKRPDGYHEVRMIMQTLELHDELTVERTADPQISISVDTDREDIPVNEDNLIYKAARLMMDEHGLSGGVKVSLVKRIPVAAGLAGGSSDAAAVLKAINIIDGLGLSVNELAETGVRIGADVPYCIMGGTVLAEGIGEILTPLPPCPEWRVLLAKPPVSVSTAHVYGNFHPENVTHPDIDLIIEGIRDGDFVKVTRNMDNVLKSVTASETPYIDRICKIMEDKGGYPLMSGSGPTVFGLFESEEDINAAYDMLRHKDFVSELFITRIFDGRA